MATKKPATTALAVPAKKTAVGAPNKLLAELAQRQQKAAASLAGSGTFASFKAGRLQIGGAAIPGNAANIIVLSTMQERAYYSDEYDPNSLTPPDCYAYGEVDGGVVVAPHPQAKDPQAKTCKDCPHSKYGSAVRGSGQACRQGVRLAFIANDGKSEAEAPVFQAKIPPTSIKNVKGWLDELGAQGLATAQVSTKLSVEADDKTQFQVLLEVEEGLDEDLQEVVAGRLAEAQEIITKPYPDEDQEDAPAKGKTAAKGKAPAKKSARY